MSTANGTIPEGATVLLQAHAQYRGPYVGILRRLKADRRSKIILYVGSQQQKEHYQRLNGDGLFDAIIENNILYAACREPSPPMDEVAAEARASEAWLGVTYNELAVSDRHLGRGYALGGFGHPRSRISEETDYRGMLNGYNRAVAFWRKEFQDKRPALVLNAPKIAAVIARRSGVPTRTLAGARYKEYYYWAVNEFFEAPLVASRFRGINANGPAQFDRPYGDHMKWRETFLKRVRFRAMVREVGAQSARYAYWHLRGYRKAKVYYLHDDLGLLYRMWRDARRLRRLTVPLSALDGARFAYYPLHMEPEAALQGLSPECFAQLATIAAIARDLPAGVLLAVKETPSAMGKRPADFYAQLREFKNVVMLDTFELGLDVVKRCAVVLTITGTGGYEGAVLGKPVIAFGRHNLYNFLPHVQMITDLGSLKDPIARALGPEFDNASAQRDGARFLAAVVASSFDMSGFSSHAPDQIPEPAIEAAYRSLVEGLA